MLKKEYKLRAGVYKVKTFRTTQGLTKEDFLLPSKGQSNSAGFAIVGTVSDRSDDLTGGFSESSKRREGSPSEDHNKEGEQKPGNLGGLEHYDFCQLIVRH